MVFTINGINEVANPLLIVIPVILMSLGGYTVGRVVSKICRLNHHDVFFKHFIFGNVLLSFIFISAFIVFGFLIPAANAFFTVFTYALVVLSIVSLFIILKPIYTSPSKIRTLLVFFSSINNRHISFVCYILIAMIIYQAIVIYYHPIFLEYDAIYLFLPISKSILLGDGLNHDFYIGSDVANKLPPFTQAINAWLIHSFGYSSLRLFPVYFVFLGSLFVYAFARNITKDRFLSLIASCAFLITPSLLITTSRFSLQQDLAFIFFLSASFYFLSKILSQERRTNVHVPMLVLTLSLMSLTREIGIVISLAIIFLLPAIRFTEANIKLRALFTVLAFLPFYLLTLYDIFQNEITTIMIVRLLSIILANFAVFFILSRIKNQSRFKVFLRSNLKYLLILGIPSIFFATNMITIGGPFATIIFTSQFNESVGSYREVFDISKNPEFIQALQQSLPRADIFLVSVAMGSIFVFIRLRGFIRLAEDFNNNNQYALVLILTIVILLVWSYLLESGFENARVRHIAYFLPITSILLVMGLNKNQGPFYKLFICGIIVFSTYYFLKYEIAIWNYNGHFGGFWLEPFNNSIMVWSDFILPGIFMLALLLLEYQAPKKLFQRFKTHNNWISNLSTVMFIALLVIQTYILYSSGLVLADLSTVDQVPPSGWERNVFEVVNYLKNAEEGKVISLRAPAVSFFTNRSNFDLFNPHTFSVVSPLLLAEKNSTILKQKVSDMDVKYIVVPNEQNTLFSATQNLNSSSHLLQIIENDEDFQRISLKGYSIFKFQPEASYSHHLLDRDKKWNSYGPLTQVFSTNDSLRVEVFSTIPDKVYNRAYMQTQLNSSLIKPPLLLSLDYASESVSRSPAIFLVEIRDENEKNLWGQTLSNTNGTLTQETFVLPDNLVDRPLEFRFYVITEVVGSHTLNVTKARVLHS